MVALSLSRRRLFELAAGTAITALLPRRAARAAVGGPSSLITIWLEGGPSQLETFDPHPGPAGGPTQAISTAIPGLSIAAHYPALAGVIDRLSVIRSLVSPEADHERAAYFLKTGHRLVAGLRHPSLGALVAEAEPPQSSLLPPHVAIGASQWPAWGGFLGERWDGLRVRTPGQPLPNLRPAVQDPARRARREALLSAVEEGTLGSTGQAAQRRRALDLMSSPEAAAFELDAEPAADRARYGDTPFGRGCLVARRLVERGARAVEVTLAGFDAHAHCPEIHAENAAILDPALAALVQDLEARDLLRSTVLLVLGEFGRTPVLNALDGRDHWPHGFSALIGGAALRSGVVIGETDPLGAAKAPRDPVTVPELTATVFTALGLDPSAVRVEPGGRPIPLSDGAPIERLLRDLR